MRVSLILIFFFGNLTLGNKPMENKEKGKKTYKG